jgi:XTP/dITP diphosphohydrolase
VITLFWEGQPHQFTGTVEGDILPAPVGTNGFGYDPVFRPLGLDQSFGQLDQAHKNLISHRARAVQQLVVFLAQKS